MERQSLVVFPCPVPPDLPLQVLPLLPVHISGADSCKSLSAAFSRPQSERLHRRFIFYPYDLTADGIILELKVDHTPEEAIQQIKDRKYALKFVPRLAEQKKYTGKILAVGIGYEKTEKKHRCRVESLN